MRCGNRLVADGDSMATVMALCGAPTSVEHGALERFPSTRAGGGRLGEADTAGSEVPVETWTYDRGPRKLMMWIRFVDGKVVAITTLNERGR